MDMLRAVPLVFAAAAVLPLTCSSTVTADCAGPSIEIDRRRVHRGGALRIDGQAFGTDCYDTGAPPPGVGVLGEPMTDLEILVVQEGKRFVVARGAADNTYEFSVNVTVPTDLQPGEARLRVIGLGAFWGVSSIVKPVRVSSRAPRGADSIVTFGPDSLPNAVQSVAPTVTAPSGDDDSDLATWWFAGIVLAVVGTAVVVLARLRRL